jgi:hypothetical protein
MEFKDFNGSKNILKIKSGESATGVFRGNPKDFRQHWKDNKSTVCTGRDTCDLCKAGEKSAFRFRINFVTRENGALLAKVFEQGKSLYEQLKLLNKEIDLEKTSIKITRQGTGTQTTYMLIPGAQITEEQDKQISELKLNEL